MTEIRVPEPAPLRRRVRPVAVVLVVFTVALAFLVVDVSYGLAREYGNTAATDSRIASQALRDWGFAVVLVAGFAAWVAATARQSRGRRAMYVTALIAAVATLVGVPAGAVLGAHQKFEAYPDLPSCTDGFNAGPAVPVTRAAQTGFAELDHPGPFSGGGSSGVDGCSTQLMVDGQVDVPARYRGTLIGNGWRISHEESDLIAATKHGQEFQASRDQDGSWWVWIGPAGLQSQPTQPGEVAPRR